MPPSNNKLLGRAQLLMVGLCGVFVGAISAAPHMLIAQPNRLAPTQWPSRAVHLPDFVALAHEFAPSLVHISTLYAQSDDKPSAGTIRDELAGLGSGIIIDRVGHIITNYHVVEHADKVVVKLSDRSELDATVVGRDARSDLAILKIVPPAGLKPAPLGDSSRVQTGEWVVAMGSPFGLDSTLTAGIVSAKARRIPSSIYYDYIQTDVSINPGNSGGPLLNLQGRVIGINTAMLSRAGANIGINFAIPINLIKDLLPELLAKGRVTRGWIGISTQVLSPGVARLLKIDPTAGALVVAVDPTGPAAHAGIHAGDIVVQYNGISVNDASELPALVAKTTVGEKIALTISRHQMLYRVTLPVGELKESKQMIADTATSPGNTTLRRHFDRPNIFADSGAAMSGHPAFLF